MAASVRSSMYFLERSELYKVEKPYHLNFDPPSGYQKSNLRMDKAEDLMIRDIRGEESKYTLRNQGFAVMKLENMSAVDFDDEESVVSTYLANIGEAARTSLGAYRVQIFDYIIRKREQSFPISTGGFYKYKQPSSICHIDTTPHQTYVLLHDLNPEEASELSKLQYQYVNIWKPIRGPVQDWPLALCDMTTVKPVEDLQARDLVNLDSYIETYLMHNTAAHKWYYLSDQTPDEAWLFLQSDSRNGGTSGVPHSAFPYPGKTVTNQCRESIEVRALVFYKPEE